MKSLEELAQKKTAGGVTWSQWNLEELLFFQQENEWMWLMWL